MCLPYITVTGSRTRGVLARPDLDVLLFLLDLHTFTVPSSLKQKMHIDVYFFAGIWPVICAWHFGISYACEIYYVPNRCGSQSNVV